MKNLISLGNLLSSYIFLGIKKVTCRPACSGKSGRCPKLSSLVGLCNIYFSLLEKGLTCQKNVGDSLHKQEMKAKVELSTCWQTVEGVCVPGHKSPVNKIRKVLSPRI